MGRPNQKWLENLSIYWFDLIWFYIYVRLPHPFTKMLVASYSFPFLFKIFSKRAWHATSNPGKSSLLGKGFLRWDSWSCHHRKCPVNWKISFSFFFFFAIYDLYSYEIVLMQLIFFISFSQNLDKKLQNASKLLMGDERLGTLFLMTCERSKNTRQAISLTFILSY